MSKIFRHSETEEIENFLLNSNLISSSLKNKIQEDLKDKGNKYKNSSIWLISRNEAITIDVFNTKGDILETNTFYYKDYL
jgi:hypothetical protein